VSLNDLRDRVASRLPTVRGRLFALVLMDMQMPELEGPAAARALRADGLRAAAKALEQAGRDGRADLATLMVSLEEQARLVFASIETLRPLPAGTAGPSAGVFDSVSAGAALDRLVRTLNDYDVSSASGALADLASSGLPAWAHDDLDRLRRSVDDYEFAEARGITSRLLARLHGAEARAEGNRR
jgi:hypothetical protein